MGNGGGEATCCCTCGGGVAIGVDTCVPAPFAVACSYADGDIPNELESSHTTVLLYQYRLLAVK